MRQGRWVGIDEAGYGPNLGPLVMSYVTAVGPIDRPPDLWYDLAATVCRAGDRSERLWIDDSKAVYAGRRGRCRLASATFAALRATGRALPGNLAELIHGLGSGGLSETELDRWMEAVSRPDLIAEEESEFVALSNRIEHFASARWRLERVRAAVLGPSRFNEILHTSRSKAVAHFSLFSELLAEIWDGCGDELETVVRCDKHGGRHFYLELLHEALPGVWIDRGQEGPSLSVYHLRDAGRSLTMEFRPKADATCGLVALASIVSKWLRECWMDQFNAFWQSRVPGLKSTAGYPQDARRFRREIEAAALAEGIAPTLWWRAK